MEIANNTRDYSVSEDFFLEKQIRLREESKEKDRELQKYMSDKFFASKNEELKAPNFNEWGKYKREIGIKEFEARRELTSKIIENKQENIKQSRETLQNSLKSTNKRIEKIIENINEISPGFTANGLFKGELGNKEIHLKVFCFRVAQAKDNANGFERQKIEFYEEELKRRHNERKNILKQIQLLGTDGPLNSRMMLQN